MRIFRSRPAAEQGMKIVQRGSDMTDVYLEDLQPGQSFTTTTYKVSAEDVKAFARQFDPQPFHLDEAAAADTFFGGLAASGWHTAAITMRLLVGSETRPALGFIGAGVEQLAWPKPVRPGDELRVHWEILETRPSRSRPTQGLARARITTVDQDNAPVQTMIVSMVVPRRAGT